ncbi:RF-1 domain-containing protein [Xylaria palmicola]|nr:RF-1 domain-containing protein [Xylaria palmicola]
MTTTTLPSTMTSKLLFSSRLPLLAPRICCRSIATAGPRVPLPPSSPARNGASSSCTTNPRPPVPTARRFSTTNDPPLHKTLSSNKLPPRPKPPPEEEIEEAFLKGSGPGGQKINKTNSAVQLRHRPTGLVVKCQATRSRSQNRTIARRLLADRLDDLARGGASRSAVVGEVRRKKKASAAKKSRRKYRKLGEEEAEAAGMEAGTETTTGEEKISGEDTEEVVVAEEEDGDGRDADGRGDRKGKDLLDSPTTAR